MNFITFQDRDSRRVSVRDQKESVYDSLHSRDNGDRPRPVFSVGNRSFCFLPWDLTFGRSPWYTPDSLLRMSVWVQSQACGGTSNFFYLSKGVARMEIEFQGRTRTATLADGQVFVALDICSGGIGFGSFIGPNGLEPAYPFAFTLGTAEYAAVTYAAPLAGTLSVTGAAWSCVGFPPLTTFACPELRAVTALHRKAIPSKSDIGNVFIYQPYYEFEGTTQIASNHSGSTNRGAFLVRPEAPDPPATSEDNPASGVVYTLQIVADGSLGGHVFNQVLVTFRMISNTHSVTSQPSSVDATKPVYENRAGYATVTVDDGGDVISADFAPGEVYVRYDTGAGVAGFGSPISPTYPIQHTLPIPATRSTAFKAKYGTMSYHSRGCAIFFQVRNCIPAQLPCLPVRGRRGASTVTSQNTLLTGPANTCAGVYTGSVDPNGYFPGDLGYAEGPAPRGLRTSKGDLFFQDLEGGTNSLGNPAVSGEAGTNGGWDLSNSGFLHMEVFGDDGHEGNN